MSDHFAYFREAGVTDRLTYLIQLESLTEMRLEAGPDGWSALLEEAENPRRVGRRLSRDERTLLQRVRRALRGLLRRRPDLIATLSKSEARYATARTPPGHAPKY
jgi:hypothetical protein